MYIVYLSLILLIITAFAGFYLSRYRFLRDKNESDARKVINESLYRYGIITDGDVITKSNHLITIFEIFDSLISRVNAHQRAISYEFTAKDGNRYSGASVVFFWLEPWVFLATNKIKVIYDPNDPTINLIYTNLKNKKYNKKD